MMARLSVILEDNKFTPADIPEFESKLFFEGDRSQKYLVHFSMLLFLSTVIAAEGVIVDSTATVIGAMIIAPLMTPILATTAAIMMGNGRRAWRSLMLVAAGSLGVVIVAAILGILVIHVVDFNTNSQITARVSPRLVDLIIALAAGTAGAFAISRDDIADSLPGVAISIALVPPLCVVGISLSGGQWADAWGALLLFLTNFLSILLAGGVVFAVLRLGAAATGDLSHLNRARAYRIIAIGVLLNAIPLTATTIKVGRDSIAQYWITNITEQWIQQYRTDFVINSVLVSGDTAKIIISGTKKPVSIEDLGERIQDKVEQVKKVNLKFIPSVDFRYAEDSAK